MFTFAYLAKGTNLPDFYDSWTTPLNNVNILAKTAKDGNLKGILLDAEMYEGSTIWDYESRPYKNTYSLDQYKAQAKQRGRDVMTQLNAQYPGITILFPYAFAFVGNPNYSTYDLLPSFVAGMIEQSDNTSSFHEIGEWAYGYTKERDYANLKSTVIANAVANVSSIYMYKYKFGFGKWPDYMSSYGDGLHPQYCWDTNINNADYGANYYAPNYANSYTAGWEQSLCWAATHTDKYVWIYSERANIWGGINWPTVYDETTLWAKTAITNPASTMEVTISN